MTRVTILMRSMLVVLLACLACGCEATVSKTRFDGLNQQWLDCLRDNRDLKRRNEQLQDTIGRQNDQIHTLQALGEKRLDLLFHVTSIELGRHSGGVDTDGLDGDDAVRVYLQPFDQDGNVIKAAGEGTVQLYDLAEPPKENLIGEYHWSVEELGKQWAGGFFGSSQFTLTCPWQHGPPVHDQITVRVTFTDYLTGGVFTAQKVVTVHLAGPASQPASAPESQATD